MTRSHARAHRDGLGSRDEPVVDESIAVVVAIGDRTDPVCRVWSGSHSSSIAIPGHSARATGAPGPAPRRREPTSRREPRRSRQQRAVALETARRGVGLLRCTAVHPARRWSCSGPGFPYRRLAREDALAPVVSWWVSGLAAYVLLDGTCRLEAALAEGVPVARRGGAGRHDDRARPAWRCRAVGRTGGKPRLGRYRRRGRGLASQVRQVLVHPSPRPRTHHGPNRRWPRGGPTRGLDLRGLRTSRSPTDHEQLIEPRKTSTATPRRPASPGLAQVKVTSAHASLALRRARTWHRGAHRPVAADHGRPGV